MPALNVNRSVASQFLGPFDGLCLGLKDPAGALGIYRGVYAFYRNGTGHRSRPNDFDPDEAMRVVSWIDHLLGLIE